MPEQDVTIVAWPEQPVILEHRFEPEKPCPVSISFDQTPANVVIQSSRELPVNVDMTMNLITRQDLPVCIKLCEPICANSEYTIKIDIFDRPVATITLRGQTKLFSSKEEG